MSSLGQRLQGLPSVRTRTHARPQRPRPRAKLGDSACSSPATVYYDAVESVQSEDEGAFPVCARPCYPVRFVMRPRHDAGLCPGSNCCG